MKRIALALAALAAAAGTFLLVRAARDRPGTPAAPDAATPGVTRPTSGHDRPVPGQPRPNSGQPTPAPDADPGVTRPTTGHDGGGGLAGRSFEFEDETRDPAWALEHERELTLRMRKIVDGLAAAGAPVDIDDIECRRSLCRISLHARNVDALSKMYGALESPDGLYGLADNVLLDSVQTSTDGRVKTRVTAVFDRE